MSASRALARALAGRVGLALAVAVGTCVPAVAMSTAQWLDNPLSVPSLADDAGAGRAAEGGAAPCTDVTAASAPVSLAEAMNTAFCNNPQVQAAWAAIRVQAGAVGEMRAAYLPRLNVSVSRLFNSTHYSGSGLPDEAGQGTTRQVSLTWRLFDFGVRQGNLTQANQLLAAAIASRDATLQKLMVALVDAYFDAVTAQAIHEARARATRLAQSTLDSTIRREARGVAAGIDVLQARTALAKAQLALARAQGDEKKAVSVLAYTMGLPGTTALTLPDGLDAPDEPGVADLTHWLSEAQVAHPAIVAAKAQLEAARAKVAATRAEGLPSLEFSRSTYKNGYPNQGLSAVQSRVTTYGLALSIPLFEGFSRVYRVSGAQAQVDQTDASLQNTVLQVSMQVVRAHADAVASLANVQASATLVEAAEAAVQSAVRRYDKGVSDILELLSTQNTQADAHQERIRCLAEWHAARLKLLAEAGVLSVVDVR